MRQNRQSKKIRREQQLTQMVYPHYIRWGSLRYLLKPGAVAQLGDKQLVLKQVIRPVISGDTPSLIFTEVVDGPETQS